MILIKQLKVYRMLHICVYYVQHKHKQNKTPVQGLLHSKTQGLETLHGYGSSINKVYLMLSQKEIYIIWCGCEQVLSVGSDMKVAIARKQIFH